MTNRIHRTLALATLILGTAAAMTACGSSPSGTAAQPAAPVTRTAEATTPPAAPPIAEPTGTTAPETTAPATTAPTQRPANAPKADDGCPVDDVVLLRIIAKDDRFVPTSGLHELTCYRGWATAGQVIDKNWWAKHGPAQPVRFIFRYDATGKRWSIASAGTGGDCPTEMPADVKTRFGYCA